MPARKRSRSQPQDNQSEDDQSEDSSAPKAGKRKGTSNQGRPKSKKRHRKGPVGSAGVHFVPDPSDTDDTETRFIQPYEATKAYLCPGCNRDIPAGMGHLVAVPQGAPDLRRHWHRGCWTNRKTRR